MLFGYPKFVTLSYFEFAKRVIDKKDGPRSSALSWLAIDFILRIGSLIGLKKIIEKIYFGVNSGLIDKDIYIIIMVSITTAFSIAMWSIIIDYQKIDDVREYSIAYAFLSFLFSFICMMTSIYVYSLVV